MHACAYAHEARTSPIPEPSFHCLAVSFSLFEEFIVREWINGIRDTHHFIYHGDPVTESSMHLSPIIERFVFKSW